jgi:hypothetical protein
MQVVLRSKHSLYRVYKLITECCNYCSETNKRHSMRKTEIFYVKHGGMLTEIMLRVRTYFLVKFMCKIAGICETSVDTDKIIEYRRCTFVINNNCMH